MGLWGIFFQAFFIGLSGAIVPGPLLTYNIQLAYKKGFWIGPKLILGHAILELLLIIGIIGGIGEFIQSPATKITLWIVGGLLLFWMGYDLIWKETRKNLNATMEVSASTEKAATSSVTNLNPVFAGIVISLSNPYWTLWWATMGIVQITRALHYHWFGVAIFFGGHILADLGWYSIISGAIAKGRQYISETGYHWLLRICGIFLFIIALGFIIDALKALGFWQFFFQQTVNLFTHMKRLI